MDARADLEKFGKQIHIELYVKVKKLRSNVNMLKVLVTTNKLVVLSF
jgi:hypothetical protein